MSTTTASTTTSCSFSVPYVAANPTSWGPPTGFGSTTNGDKKEAETASSAAALPPPELFKFAHLPYAPFGRSDRLGRAADFTGRAYYSQQYFAGSNYGGGGGGGNRGGGGGGQQQSQQRGPRRDGAESRQNSDMPPVASSFANRDESAAIASEYPNYNDNDDGPAATSFQLVDTSKTTTTSTKRFVTPAARRRLHTARLKQVNARRQQASGGGATPNWMESKLSTRSRSGPPGAGMRPRGPPTGGRGGPGGGGFGGRGPGGPQGGALDRQPSVSVQRDTWIQVEELDLSKLTKHLHPSMMEVIPAPEDVMWAGFLDPYNEVYDKVTARQPVPLKRMEHKEFYPVTTTDDPVLEKLAIDGEVGQVFCTDAILAHLMTCTRSVYPWDIVVQKLPNGLLFLDKRDNSQFDFLTVHETSYHPPHQYHHHHDDPESINSPQRLGLEATMINQNFSQQILRKVGRKEMELPNPFFDEEDNPEVMEPASVAFRYRKFQLDPLTTLVCRTELHGVVKQSQYMTAFCLNEYQPSTGTAAGGGGTPQTSPGQMMSWRDKIDSQRGAVLANELKNNSFKLAKWTAQSLLAGADQMKIGFVSRASPKNAYEHVILATEFYRPKDFAAQITLSEAQMWGMIRFFVQLFKKQDTGKYVLLRDPNKATLRLYKVPPETFEEDE